MTTQAERWAGAGAPWPVVAECYTHADGTTCRQCDGSHEHQWKAWNPEHGHAIDTTTNGVPVRCVDCGARKCDMPACMLRRHHYGDDHALY